MGPCSKTVCAWAKTGCLVFGMVVGGLGPAGAQEAPPFSDATFSACVDRCVRDRCHSASVSDECETQCGQECSVLAPNPMILGTRVGPSSVVGDPDPPLSRDLAAGSQEGDKGLPGEAIAVLAFLMVPPVFSYALDQPPRAAQVRRYHQFRLFSDTGLGVAVPGRDLFRARTTVEWWMISAGADWISWTRDDQRLDRVTVLLGPVLAPKRHSELRILGGPAWEWSEDGRVVGGVLALPSVFHFSEVIALLVDPRVGRIGSRVVADLSLHLGLRLREHLWLLLGGQGVFRSKEFSGGPQLLLRAQL